MSNPNEKETTSIIVFIPFIVCIVSIAILLNIRYRQTHPQNTNSQNINGLGQDFQPLLDEDFSDQEDLDSEENDDNNAGEGSSSSTAIRIKKMGKKRGEKLRRKEQMRQYREYLEQQREIRKAQDEINEQEFRRRQVEQSIQHANESEKRRKEKLKRQKLEENEKLKRQKMEEKEAKNRQYKFEKYKGKMKQLVKEKKFCQVDELVKMTGLSREDVVDILNQLCESDTEFELCLWSAETDAFLFVTRQDYEQFNNTLDQKGKMSLYEGEI